MKRFDQDLTKENVGEIVGMFREVLAGKLFTVVTVRQTRGYQPEIHINQCLEGTRDVPRGGAENIRISDDGEGFTLADSFGLVQWRAWRKPGFAFVPASHREPDQIQVTFANDFGDTIFMTFVPTGELTKAATA